jgi:hypothetical protein
LAEETMELLVVVINYASAISTTEKPLYLNILPHEYSISFFVLKNLASTFSIGDAGF